MPARIKVNKGDRYGRWTIIKEVEKRGQKRCFLCKCDCETIKVVRLGLMRIGHSKSCGCYCREINKKKKTKHGKSGSRIYQTWSDMKRRCLNKNKFAYEYYGGRGISVCDEW